jgi:pyruvate,water dikinase
VLNAAWGLGSAVAQGEVVPDRIVLDRSDRGVELRNTVLGRRMHHRIGCMHAVRHTEPRANATKRCLTDAQALELGRLVLRAEAIMGLPVEVEWARDAAGFALLQARPLYSEPAPVPDQIWLRHPGLHGQAAGVGWGSGRACVVNCECELSRVGPGDILVTKVAGPALGQVLPRVAGVVAELGGSTSHLASLARERGIPMVLGVLDATERIPDGVQVAVDGVAGVVRWIR